MFELKNKDSLHDSLYGQELDGQAELLFDQADIKHLNAEMIQSLKDIYSEQNIQNLIKRRNHQKLLYKSQCLRSMNEQIMKSEQNKSQIQSERQASDASFEKLRTEQKSGEGSQLLHKSILTSNTSQIKIDDCAICYDCITDSQLVKVLQPCNHYFHNDCINQWLIIEKRCPMCMNFLNKDDQKNDNVNQFENQQDVLQLVDSHDNSADYHEIIEEEEEKREDQNNENLNSDREDNKLLRLQQNDSQNIQRLGIVQIPQINNQYSRGNQNINQLRLQNV